MKISKKLMTIILAAESKGYIVDVSADFVSITSDVDSGLHGVCVFIKSDGVAVRHDSASLFSFHIFTHQVMREILEI